MECKIFFSIDDEITELDIQEKGWRGDVIVKIGDKLYHPAIITLARLEYEFKESESRNVIYDIEPNLIIVKKTDKNSIIKAIEELYKNNYFNRLKDIKLNEEFSYNESLLDLKSWICVN